MPIITVDGLHQLHILIFFLACFHVVYSAVTMALGRLKVVLYMHIYTHLCVCLFSCIMSSIYGAHHLTLVLIEIAHC